MIEPILERISVSNLTPYISDAVLALRWSRDLLRVGVQGIGYLLWIVAFLCLEDAPTRCCRRA